MPSTVLALELARRRTGKLLDRAVAADLELAELLDTGRAGDVGPAMTRATRALELAEDAIDTLAELEVDELLAGAGVLTTR